MLTLFDPPEFIVWNIYGLRDLVLKKLGFKNLSLWQSLNFFAAFDENCIFLVRSFDKFYNFLMEYNS